MWWNPILNNNYYLYRLKVFVQVVFLYVILTFQLGFSQDIISQSKKKKKNPNFNPIKSLLIISILI